MINYTTFDQAYYDLDIKRTWYVMINREFGYDGITHNEFLARQFMLSCKTHRQFSIESYVVENVNWFKLKKLCEQEPIRTIISLYDMMVTYNNDLLTNTMIVPCRSTIMKHSTEYRKILECGYYILLKYTYVDMDLQIYKFLSGHYAEDRYYENIIKYLMKHGLMPEWGDY